jgi:chromosome segregation ATPase
LTNKLETDLAKAIEAVAERDQQIEKLQAELSSNRAEISSLHSALSHANDRVSHLDQVLEDADAARGELEQRVVHLETRLEERPTNEQVQRTQQQLEGVQEEKEKLQEQVANLHRKMEEWEADRGALHHLKAAYSDLEQQLARASQLYSSESEDKRVLQLQLDHLHRLEVEHATLQKRLVAAEKRTEVVGMDQQHNVQTTRRVLREMCEVLHAANIPTGSQKKEHTREGALQTQAAEGGVMSAEAFSCSTCFCFILVFIFSPYFFVQSTPTPNLLALPPS